MMDKASVFRTEESLVAMLDILADLKDRYERVGVQDKSGVQLRPHRRPRARLPARPRECLVISGRAAPRAAGALA
jgi:succinate dehydrogenase/fumarate reductase flavoprotein subunit